MLVNIGQSSKTLQQIQGFQVCVPAELPLYEVVNTLKTQSDIPGVIIIQGDNIVGMLSRQYCFEILGKPYGIELFIHKAVIEIFQKQQQHFLLLDPGIRIEDAVALALNRPDKSRYDPVVIEKQDGLEIVDMHTLLTEQSNLLQILLKQVKELSNLDPLTSLLNRRGFFESVNRLIQEGSYNSFSTLMIDIDYFKLVNDRYGHPAGDKVIKLVGETCQRFLRENDQIGRYGGEEYCIFLPDVSHENAIKIAERIRSEVSRTALIYDGSKISVTVSIGLHYAYSDTVCLEESLSRADNALYAAKHAGRNVVYSWPEDCFDLLQNGKIKNITNKTRKSRSDYDQKIIARVYDETVEGWARTLEYRDKEVMGHSHRVTHLTLQMASLLGYKSPDLVHIRRGAMLHDIGKIAIPDEVLFKQGSLTPEEWQIMQKHPVYAYELLVPIEFLRESLDIPYCHHEHWDGGGYPRGLKGEQIPKTARMFTIIDVWDALCSNRCYRKAWSVDRIRAYLVEQKGKLFDPDMVDYFMNHLLEEAVLICNDASKY